MTRILIVEDDPLVREFLISRLRMERGITVVEAVADAASACACLRREEIDLILLDYRLEGADGMQLLSSLTLWLGNDEFAANKRRPHVLFCTGLATDAFEAEARAMGAKGVVAKEKAMVELIPAVHTVMGGNLWFNHGPCSDGVAAGAKRRILVADNNRPTRATLSKMLQDHGYEVTLVWSYEDILAVLTREAYDLLIVDARLPGGARGTDVLDEVAGRQPSMPILLLGAAPQGMEHFQPVQNVQGVITRPVADQQVLGELQKCWRWAEARATEARKPGVNLGRVAVAV